MRITPIVNTVILSSFLIIGFCTVNTVPVFAQKEETSVIVVYRQYHATTDKHFLFVQIDYNQVDSLPPGCQISFLAHSVGQFRVSGKIKSYPGWPFDKIEVTTIPNDTAYIKAEITRDAFGNARIKFAAVSQIDAMSDIAASSDCVLSRSDNEEYDSGNDIKKSGTGFLISNNGLIITNHHLVENAKRITIRNINGDRELSVDATLIAKDMDNDLVLLKLPDSIIAMTGAIPFNIRSIQADLGEKAAVFGYPLTTTMGQDVKLTNGIISSVNGYQGNANSYQLTAPVQPGNSGGPVFDEQANLIGVVNAKHLLAENATYAIKSTYLLNFLQSVPEYSSSVVNSTMEKMQLVEQAKTLQKLVYIIEIR